MEKFSDEQLLQEIKMANAEHKTNLDIHPHTERKSFRHMCNTNFLLLQRHGKL